ncbi:MAG: hypothetical protein MJA83_19715 [Gammaproteobacteria bacterium]|nr:hypothetical protein [Gammaproteobacteria bacterium]
MIANKSLQAFVLAAFVISAGLIISIASSNWDWFSRSGSLVAVIGIWLTSGQIRAHMHELKFRKEQWSGRQFNHDWAKDGRVLEKTRVSEAETWANERSGFFLLILGTLIWGFGDLLLYVF